LKRNGETTAAEPLFSLEYMHNPVHLKTDRFLVEIQLEFKRISLTQEREKHIIIKHTLFLCAHAWEDVQTSAVPLHVDIF
jgi:hypothetical protein